MIIVKDRTFALLWYNALDTIVVKQNGVACDVKEDTMYGGFAVLFEVGKPITVEITSTSTMDFVGIDVKIAGSQDFNWIYDTPNSSEYVGTVTLYSDAILTITYN